MCGRCRDTYWAAYNYMTEQEALDKKKDAKFMACWNQARDALEDKEVAQMRLAEVTKSTTSTVTLARRVMAYTRSQFERRFGADPSSLNVKPIDALDEHGDNFQCYLIDEIDTPRELTIAMTQSHEHCEYAMAPQHALFSDQAAQAYKGVTTAPKSAWLRKISKVRSAAEVEAAVAQQKEKEAIAAGGDDSDSEVDDLQEQSEMVVRGQCGGRGLVCLVRWRRSGAMTLKRCWVAWGVGDGSTPSGTLVPEATDGLQRASPTSPPPTSGLINACDWLAGNRAGNMGVCGFTGRFVCHHGDKQVSLQRAYEGL